MNTMIMMTQDEVANIASCFMDENFDGGYIALCTLIPSDYEMGTDITLDYLIENYGYEREEELKAKGEWKDD